MTRYFNARTAFAFAAFLLLALGLAVRLYDLTDPPIDFHPTRQLRSAIIARGIYYQSLTDVNPEIRDTAIAFGNSTGQYEPPILEKIVANTYRLIGEEVPWIARIYNSSFWIIGGIAVFLLALRMSFYAAKEGKSIAACGSALIALAYYLILPFGVQASRSFQPDPGMVMWIILAVFSLYRWSETRSWKWALAAGIFAGIAVVIKAVAAYIVAGAAVGLVLYTLGIKRFWRSAQVWTMAAVMITPSIIFYLIDNEARAAEYFQSWTIDLSHLLLNPATYARWFNLVQSLMGLAFLVLALIGVLIAKPRNRALLLGLWIGYGIYGLFLPYQMYTHNYYHLQLIPMIAISLIPVIQMIMERISSQPKFWQASFVVIIMGAILYSTWVSVAAQRAEDHHREPAYWEEIASYLPTDGKILALTQDYGYRLMYYGWRKVILWPIRGERQLAKLRGKDRGFEEYFNKRAEGKSYFLITAFGQFNGQPDLKEWLYEYYPVYAEGDGYLIFDLTQKKATP